MPLYNFTSGTIAHAEEVNSNFDYILSILAGMGAVDRIGELQIGPRGTGLLSAAHDTGGATTNFLQVGWNADWNNTGTSYVFSRLVPNAGATALRIGDSGIDILLTSATTGNLNSQMKSAMRLRENPTENDKSYLYLAPNIHMTNVNKFPDAIQDYRLTYTPMTTPPAIYSDAYLQKTLVVKKATDFGVPTNARAISIFAYVTATTSSGAGLKMYQEREGRSQRYGFTTHAPIGTIGRAGGWGVVPLGVDTLASKFVLETTYAIEEAHVYIVGYWS